MERETVLVVDDGDSNRLLITSYLEESYRVLEAESGPAALATLAREVVDLVLLDVMMPEMDGYQVCREIKARFPEAFLPVLLHNQTMTLTTIAER